MASDNVLDNWSCQTPGGNVSNSRIGGAGMRAQEALNDSHSARCFGAGNRGDGPSLENDSVQLSASAETFVRRDVTGTHAAVQEKTLALNLTAATYRNLLRAGIPFAEYIDHPQAAGTVRIIVVDENSGRMGSVTLPEMLERASR